tara:strand:- start:38 stop:730 length:693 start_codon:yes stop_codon:yes gene_type:complete
MGDQAFCKVAERLMDSGLILTSWHYSSEPPSITYGQVEEENTSYEYEITLDGETAFMAKYLSDAKEYVEQLKENNFDASYIRHTNTKSKLVWQQPKGSKFYLGLDAFEGELAYNKSHLSYTFDGSHEGAVTLTPTMRNTADGVELTLTTQLTLDKVLKADRIKPVMVDITLNDFGIIKSLVEDALRIFKPHTTDCTFDVKTHSESECSPDIIAQREEATKLARNASQEEE